MQPIENTNLILVIVNSTLLDLQEDLYDPDVTITTIPEEIILASNETLYCEKILSNDLPRKRPKDCINKHDKVRIEALLDAGNSS